MSTDYMLMQLIDHAFEKEAGRLQCKKPGPERVGLSLTVSLNCDWEKEEGYRHADLVIYAYTNYVQVYSRTRANVAPIDEDGEMGEYEESATPWELKCCHDSCYRTAIEDFFRENEGKGAGPLQHNDFPNGFFNPYTVTTRDDMIKAGVPLKKEYDEGAAA